MNKRVVLCFGCAVLFASPVAAQSAFLGADAGIRGVPPGFDEGKCDDAIWLALEPYAGLELGFVRAEARVGLQRTHSLAECLTDRFGPGDGFPPPDLRDGSGASLEARLGFAVPSHPLRLSAGAGWLPRAETPFLVVGAGIRTFGRVGLTVGVDRRWYRVERIFWAIPNATGAGSADDEVGWPGAWAVRLGLETALP